MLRLIVLNSKKRANDFVLFGKNSKFQFCYDNYCRVINIKGCGKHEAAGGASGALIGAAIGHSVSGSKSSGTVIGGLIGHVIGSKIGESEDENEEEEIKAIHENIRNCEIENLQNENAKLRQTFVRWCSECGRRNSMIGAHSCPECGGVLIRERFCKNCFAVFTPQSGFVYCPYCRVRTLLCGR